MAVTRSLVPHYFLLANISLSTLHKSLLHRKLPPQQHEGFLTLTVEELSTIIVDHRKTGQEQPNPESLVKPYSPPTPTPFTEQRAPI